MKVLFDTNVVLDVLLKREPFAIPAARLFVHVERGEIQGLLGATTLTTIYYLVSKVTDRQTARASVRGLVTLFEVAPVTRAVIEAALEQSTPDFEDAVLVEAGRRYAADVVVTGNQKHFHSSGFPVYTPLDLLAYLAATGGEQDIG